MATTLEASHGDTWLSPIFIVTLHGNAVDLEGNWYVWAQARRRATSADAPFEWSVEAGNLILGRAKLKMSDESEIETSTVQLTMRPVDWIGRPRKFSGVLDIEFATDDSDTPVSRHTPVSNRPFVVTPDVARRGE